MKQVNIKLQFLSAVYTLITSPYEIRERVLEACRHIQPVRDLDIPEDMKEDWVWIKKILAAKRITQDKWVEVADRLFEINHYLVTRNIG